MGRELALIILLVFWTYSCDDKKNILTELVLKTSPFHHTLFLSINHKSVFYHM